MEIALIKKIIQKELLNEMYKKDIIDFLQYNMITKKLESDISKLKNSFEESAMPNMTFKVLI